MDSPTAAFILSAADPTIREGKDGISMPSYSDSLFGASIHDLMGGSLDGGSDDEGGMNRSTARSATHSLARSTAKSTARSKRSTKGAVKPGRRRKSPGLRVNVPASVDGKDGSAGRSTTQSPLRSPTLWTPKADTPCRCKSRSFAPRPETKEEQMVGTKRGINGTGLFGVVASPSGSTRPATSRASIRSSPSSSLLRKSPHCSHLMRSYGDLSAELSHSRVLPELSATFHPKMHRSAAFASQTGRSELAQRDASQPPDHEEEPRPKVAPKSRDAVWTPLSPSATHTGVRFNYGADVTDSKRSLLTGTSPFGLERNDIDQGPKYAAPKSTFGSQRESGFRSPAAVPKGFGKSDREQWKDDLMYYPGVKHPDRSIQTELVDIKPAVGVKSMNAEWRSPPSTSLGSGPEKLPWPERKAPGAVYDVYGSTLRKNHTARIGREPRKTFLDRPGPASPSAADYNTPSTFTRKPRSRAAGFGYGRRGQWIDVKGDDYDD